MSSESDLPLCNPPWKRSEIIIIVSVRDSVEFWVGETWNATLRSQKCVTSQTSGRFGPTHRWWRPKVKLATLKFEVRSEKFSVNKQRSDLCFPARCFKLKLTGGLQVLNQLQVSNIRFNMLDFYRTQVNLGFDLWVWTPDLSPYKSFEKLNWCDSGWWRYQLKCNW